MALTSITVGEIAAQLDAEIVGDAGHEIHGIASLDKASASDISFLANPRWKAQLDTTLAGCVLLSAEMARHARGNRLIVKDPYLSYAKVAQLLDTTPISEPGVHPTAFISPGAQLGSGVSIGPGCYVDDGCQLDENVILGANCSVGRGSKIGANSRIFANVSIYHYVSIGEHCIFHSGVVVGSDGFGYASENRQWVKIPQLGRLVIGNRVEIGANSCIDRGALNDTLIGDGVKIDNLCHIAHNVEIGDHAAMAACSGIAGSSTIGKYTTLSGRASIIGHLTIAEGSHITACSLINKSIPKAGIYSSGTGMQENKTWRRNVARFRQLDDMARQLRALQKQMQQMQQTEGKLNDD